MSLKEGRKEGALTTSRTMVRPSRRMTSMPRGFGAGFAMAETMAMEARMRKVGCMMDDLIVLGVIGGSNGIVYDCVQV